MSNKQSSVDWLLEQLIEHRYIIVNKTTYGDKVKAKHEILLEQAKAMHKTEHFNTWWHGISENEPITFEQYYNETFEQ
jgi:pyruvate/2-oxoglutarate dehydrogenase complex dihydrolipoamide acyltransferase (E2) component